MNGGKLIVFEGTDGSGKKTQAELLIRYLDGKKIPHTMLDFPRYDESFFGALAKELLLGKLGPIDAIPAKLAVLPFACDRWLAKGNIEQSLSDGKLVVSNRYTASSAVYHAAKLPPAEHENFMQWTYTLEQEKIGLPKEDLVLFFHMPVTHAQSLMQKRYAGGEYEKDVYEKDIKLLQTVEHLYLTLASRHSHWKTIQCVRDNQIKTPEEIHKEVLDVLTQNGIL